MPKLDHRPADINHLNVCACKECQPFIQDACDADLFAELEFASAVFWGWYDNAKKLSSHRRS